MRSACHACAAQIKGHLDGAHPGRRQPVDQTGRIRDTNRWRAAIMDGCSEIHEQRAASRPYRHASSGSRPSQGKGRGHTASIGCTPGGHRGRRCTTSRQARQRDAGQAKEAQGLQLACRRSTVRIPDARRGVPQAAATMRESSRVAENSPCRSGAAGRRHQQDVGSRRERAARLGRHGIVKYEETLPSCCYRI